MSINFCDALFQPRIHCDKISADNYELKNLISSSAAAAATNSHHQNGFMVERFIKCPVSVTIEFPCTIDIHRVIIDCCVGSQKSTGFEISTRSGKISNPWIISEQTAAPPTRKQTATPPTRKQTAAPSTSGLFRIVARFRNTSEKTVINFENDRFTPRLNLRSYSSWWSLRLPIIDTDINSRNSREINALTIRVVQTSNGSIPALKRLAVLGEPSISNHRTLIQTIVDIHNQLLQSLQLAAPQLAAPRSVTVTEESCTNSKTTRSKINDDEIPIDFLDEITCDLMTIPMLLPSGHNIDQTTLERIINDDKVKGRVPSDPFTGVTLTEINKCIPNGKLKSRIDQFLLKSGIFTSCRTVGSIYDVHNLNYLNKLSENQTLRTPISTHRTPISTHSTPISTHRTPISTHRTPISTHRTPISTHRTPSSTHSTPSSTHRTPISTHRTPISTHRTPISTQRTVSYARSCPPSCPSSSKSSNERSASSAECKIDDESCKSQSEISNKRKFDCSIDLSVLSGLPSYLTKQRPLAVCNKTRKSCVICDENIETASNVYEFPCKHFICRNCVIQSKTCHLCNLSFTAKQIQKINL
ncbi:RING finger protein 37-like [Tubulanus polymorphus]|uniref:RING finger protein 37-like n=1 Tax=Tubulanus polymorphus TaxID=672921 RepID=UPI003DA4EDA5